MLGFDVKLIIHAGTHKTATTSFQSKCMHHREELMDSGILYPVLNFKPENKNIYKLLGGNIHKLSLIQQHSYLLRLLQQDSEEDVKRFFLESLEIAHSKGCEYVLISGEDLENCLIDNSLAQRIVEIGISAGFSNIQWVFTKRDGVDYFYSLYYQLATQRVTCNPLSLIESIDQNGYFVVSNPNGVFFFVFDLSRRVTALEEKIGCDIDILSYVDFLEIAPGFNLIKRLASTENSIDYFKSNVAVNRTKASLDSIEFKYACNYLSLDHSQLTFDLHKDLLVPIINIRLQLLDSIKVKIEHVMSQYG